MKKQQLALIILGIAAIVVGIFLLSQKQKTTPPPLGINQPPTNTTTDNLIKFSGEAKIEINQTVPPGDRLTIAKIIMPGKGFVAIKDKTGKIIGSGNLIIFPETQNFSIPVELKSDQTYTAELHGDDGNGIFDPQKDPPMIINGKTITAKFKTQ